MKKNLHPTKPFKFIFGILKIFYGKRISWLSHFYDIGDNRNEDHLIIKHKKYEEGNVGVRSAIN